MRASVQGEGTGQMANAEKGEGGSAGVGQGGRGGVRGRVSVRASERASGGREHTRETQ